MRRMFSMMAIAVAIVVLPAIAMADGDKDKAEKGHKRPNVKAWFERLDADKDGQLTTNEMPQRLQERLGDSLKKADTNGDQKLSLGEFKALMKSRWEAAKGKRAKGKKCCSAMKGAKGCPMTGAKGKKCCSATKDKKCCPMTEAKGNQCCPMTEAKGKKGHHTPDFKAIFARLDTNNDQKLCVEEFTAGAKKMHARIAAHMKKAAARHGDHPKHGSHARRGDYKRHGGHAKGGHGKPSPEMIKKFRAKMDARFKAADKNNDGKLSKEEASDRLKSRFEKIDADKDGQLTREELKKAFKARHKAKGKGHNHDWKDKHGRGWTAPPTPPKA